MQKPQKVVLFGASAFMASVEAVLQKHPGFLVQRMPYYDGLPELVDAVLVDSNLESGQIYQLVKENRGIPIFFLNGGTVHLTALISKEHHLQNATDLVKIIGEYL
jgi:hypothetical protein